MLELADLFQRCWGGQVFCWLLLSWFYLCWFSCRSSHIVCLGCSCALGVPLLFHVRGFDRLRTTSHSDLQGWGLLPLWFCPYIQWTAAVIEHTPASLLMSPQTIPWVHLGCVLHSCCWCRWLWYCPEVAPLTLYSSNTFHSLFLFTLSKAFSWSTNTMVSSSLYSTVFLLSCLRAKIASVHHLPFLKPICASLSRGSTLYRVRCSRIFAYILPVWLRRDIPRYVLQSFLLPFFFPDGYHACTLLVFWDFPLCPRFQEYCGQPSGCCFSTCQDSFRCNAISSRCFVLWAGLQCPLYLWSQDVWFFVLWIARVKLALCASLAAWVRSSLKYSCHLFLMLSSSLIGFPSLLLTTVVGPYSSSRYLIALTILWKCLVESLHS